MRAESRYRNRGCSSASRDGDGVISARPRTIMRRKMSPLRCTLLSKLSASRCATVDLPAAITPVITMTMTVDSDRDGFG